MSTEQRVLDISLEAAEDLSSYQYHFVVRDTTTGKARLLDAAGEIAEGVLQNAPTAGQAAAIRVIGDTKIKVNAALAIGKMVAPEFVSVTDCGKAADAGTVWKATRGIVLQAAAAEDDLATVRLIGPFPQSHGTLIGQTTVTTIATADAVTYTAAQLLGGLIARDPAGGNRTDVSPTAAQIVAAIAQAGVGNSFEFTIRNTADANEVITLGNGTGVTISGTATIGQNNSKRFLVRVDSSTAVTIYSLGTVVH